MGHSGGAFLGEVKGLAHIPSVHLAVNAQLRDAEAKATDVLVSRQATLLALAKALDRQGYLSGAEIEAVIKETRENEPTNADDTANAPNQLARSA